MTNTCAAGVKIDFNKPCPKCGVRRGDPCPEGLAREREAFGEMLAAARLAADALMNADPGNPADETGWAHDESRDAWVALTDAITKATGL